MGLVVALTLATASVFTANAARAELDFRWEAPANCPQRGVVMERIRSLTGSTLDQEKLRAEGRVTQVGGRFFLTLLVRDGSGPKKRVIASDSCANLAGAAAVTLALLLGVDLGSSESRTATESENGLETLPSSSRRSASSNDEDDATPTTPRDTARDDRKRDADDESQPGSERVGEGTGGDEEAPGRSWALLVRAPALLAELGPLPNPSLGVGVGIGFRHQTWRVLLQGQLFREQTLEAPGPGGALGVELQRVTGKLTACHGFRVDRFEIAPCVSAIFETLEANGSGSGITGRSSRTAWLAPAAGATLFWYPSEAVALFGAVTGAVQLARPRLVVEDFGEIDQVAPVSAGVSVGLEWIL
jgi:hypothetical protein